VSLGCAQCGDCCEEIWIPVAQAEVTRYSSGRQHMVTNDRWGGRYQIAFFAAFWTRIDQKFMTLTDGTVVHKTRYSCAKYDVESRTCTAHSLRPQVCRDYPWYGREPSASGMSRRLRCSYLLDLPPDQRPENAYPLIPLEIL
jgi:Fe-S-cluster containining protein